MKKMMSVVVIVLVLSGLCYSVSFGAEFRLKNGDAVSGELMSYDGTIFRVKSSFGVLSIEASEMAVIGLNTEEGVVDIVLGAPTTSDRDRVKGTIEYVREGEVKIKTDYGYVVVNPLDKATGIFLSEAEAGQVKPGAAIQPVKGQQVVEAKGINFTLQECKRSGESVTCYFLITSNGQDRKLQLYGDDASRLFDDAGNEYRANMSQLGDESDNDYVTKTLPTGIPIKASLGFEGIASGANLIALIELWNYGDYDGGGKFKVEFRNVPFSQ